MSVVKHFPPLIFDLYYKKLILYLFHFHLLTLDFGHKFDRYIEKMASRKFFVGGNWKMNGNFASINDLLGILNQSGGNTAVEIVVSPPGTIRSVPNKIHLQF